MSRGKTEKCDFWEVQGTSLKKIKDIPLGHPLKSIGTLLRDAPTKSKGIPLSQIKALQGVYFEGMAMVRPLQKKALFQGVFEAN
ncbi:hypothetical protein [uncultured Anaerolinea sp.]|uniref:hypothetical protein n=1 Tax=uncultured Anaerolinea sp. TaxID=430695 RepID=UPI00260DA618|nr:hypothetical protein [uncultured Anaerolinea sp.]